MQCSERQAGNKRVICKVVVEVAATEVQTSAIRSTVTVCCSNPGQSHTSPVMHNLVLMLLLAAAAAVSQFIVPFVSVRVLGAGRHATAQRPYG